MQLKSRFLCAAFAAVSFPALLSAVDAPLPSVVVRSVEPLEYTPMITEIGEVQAEDSVDLVARVKGFLSEVNFVEGSRVKAGTVLFQIDSAEYEAKVKQAESALLKTRAAKKHSDNEYLRQKELYQKNAISDKEFKAYEARKYENDAELMTKEAALSLAHLDLKYTKIIAPFDGWVGFKTYSRGNMVGPQSEKLGTIEKAGRVKVNFNVPETAVVELTENARRLHKKATDAKVELFDQRGRKINLSGHLAAWDNRINRNTGTLKLQALFDDPERRLIPGFYVKVRLFLGSPKKILAVPKEAVVNDVLGSYVFVVGQISGNSGTVEQRYVKVLSAQPDIVFLSEGLKQGDLVISAGTQKVRPKAKCSFTREGLKPASQKGKASNDKVPVKS